MKLNHLNHVRFLGDKKGARALTQDKTIARFVREFGQDQSSNSARKELLGNAVRVDEHILPELGRAVSDLHRRSGIEEDLECFVYANPMIDACVFRSRSRYFVLLSSAAIERLDADELQFVIGHEIGHVVYDHFKIPVGQIFQSEDKIAPKQAIELLSWQRHAEISADRAGLLCCGSLNVAASAFFKVLSGLSIPDLQVNPGRFAAQFDHLREEIFREGAEDMWTMSHPLSPLRMKSMHIFWESDDAKKLLPDAPGGRSRDSCDREINDLLAYMDPRGRRSDSDAVDPLIEPFLTWGGLIIAGSDKHLDPSELKALASIVGEHHLKRAMEEPRKLSHWRQRFSEALEQRKQPLSALDINRIFTCLIAIVRADGKIEPQEVAAMHDLGLQLGVSDSYIDGLLGEF